MKELAPRKNPSQERSRQMVDAILEASIRILKKNGKAFNTIKVAEAAGISVGSLYQYFPHKEAILFHLQAREWGETWAQMDAILLDRRQSPEDRLRTFVVEFFKTELNEAELRRCLEEAHAACEQTPAFRQLQARADQTLRVFLLEYNPDLDDLDFLVDFVMTTLSRIVSEVSSRPIAEKDLVRWAEKVAAMVGPAIARTP